MKGYFTFVEKYIKYCDFKISPEKFIRFVLILAIAMLSLSIIVYFTSGLFVCLAVIIVLVIVELFLHFVLIAIASRRASLSEEMLPDLLRLISSNLRAGVMPERAFLLSARKEFGPLSKQIEEAGKCLIVGESIEKAFRTIPEKINSSLLRKTINLIVEGITKGGNLAPLLENLAEDIKSTLILRKDIKAHVASYTMFIFMAIGFGSPILYATSLYLTETLIKLGNILPKNALQAGTISLYLGNINLSLNFIFWYAIGLMIISAIFGSLLIGLIKEGKEFAGIKYIPILIAMELAIFWFVKFNMLATIAVSF